MSEIVSAAVMARAMPPHEAGFTLVELLVAMVAASLLLGSLSWMVSTLGRELTRPEHDVQLRQIDAARPVLKSLLEGAALDSATGPAFERRADGFSAIVAAPQALGPVGLVRMELSRRAAKAGEGLFVGFAPAAPNRPLPPGAETPHALVMGLRSIHFDYVDRAGNEPGALPKLITITLTGAKRDLPALTIQPQVSGSGTCRFDPISMACRP